MNARSLPSCPSGLWLIGPLLLLSSSVGAQELLPADAAPVGSADAAAVDTARPGLPSPFLDEITVRARPPLTAASSDVVSARDLAARPIRTPSDLLRIVPGLVTGNHAGGGKAEQIFLRGFDADHGTDVAIFVDGVPVNMRSHAHGQGYADMHFVIPELVERVEVRKGPYFPEIGDFGVAGAARFRLRDRLDEALGFVQASGGSFSTQRYLAAATPSTEGPIKTLVATEAYFSDGPFQSEQNLERYNSLARIVYEPQRDLRLSLWLSDFRSRWGASGQVPQREVVNGRLNRFGAIDPSEGGLTERQNAELALTWAPHEDGELTASLYTSRYRLRLWSNFSFFQTDPVLGDGIEQRDTRWLAGSEVGYRHFFEVRDVPVVASAGLSWRSDFPHVILASQFQRNRLTKTQDVKIEETSFGGWVQLEVQPLPRLRAVVGGRWELYHFHVEDQLDPVALSGHETDDTGPLGKAALILSPAKDTEVYLDFGMGYHSNDARSVVAAGGLPSLPLASCYEVGFRTFLFERLDLSAAFFLLDLESELVLVGDEGVVEARGATRRLGGELEARLQLFEWLRLETDLSYTEARFRRSGDAVPLAPRFLARAGVTFRYELGPGAFEATVQMRGVGDRPANEDESATAQGYTVWDLLLRYQTERVDLFVRVDNLFDKRWRETQFFSTSQLRGENAPVDDIHFTPGNPIGVEGGVRIKF